MKPRGLVIGLAGALVVGALAWIVIAKPFGPRVPTNMPMQNAGDYQVGLANTPDPPSPGENTATIVVRDRDGRPVRGATIEARFVMEAMGSMPRMESRGRVESPSPGVYRTRYGLSMAGEWDVSLKILPPSGEAIRADYRLSTSAPGFAFVSATPANGAAAGEATRNTERDVAPDPTSVMIDDARRQQLGIKVEPVTRRALATTVRASGRVAWDETRVRDFSLKYGGTVRTLAADFTGRAVRAGEPLFTVYSPDVLGALQEYVEATRAAKTDQAARDLATAARHRLELWDVPKAQLDGIAVEGRARDVLPVLSPASGVVVEKKVVAGSSFNAGDVLFRIAPLDPIWVMASVFQVDLPLVKVGAPVIVANPYLDGGKRQGRVAFIAPTLGADTRTAEVRIAVPNGKADLKPGMFVDVTLERVLGERLAIPESAVLPTGERRVVFVDLGAGRLAARDVKLGVRAGDWYEVLGGLAEGDRVVTSGNFVVSSEARLKSASDRW